MPAPAALLLQDAVYAGLDAVRAALLVDLCAYLHLADDARPQLYLRAPELATLPEDEALALFAALHDLLPTLPAGPQGQAPVEVAGYAAHAVVSAGTRSRGVHVVGRVEGPLAALDDRELATLVPLCRSVGALAHALADASLIGPRGPIGPLTIELNETRARATITVPFAGGRRLGTAVAPSSPDAVALAVLDALPAALELGDARTVELGLQQVALVLLHHGDGRRAAGSALVEGDPLVATAAATLDAATRLLAVPHQPRGPAPVDLPAPPGGGQA